MECARARERDRTMAHEQWCGREIHGTISAYTHDSVQCVHQQLNVRIVNCTAELIYLERSLNVHRRTPVCVCAVWCVYCIYIGLTFRIYTHTQQPHRMWYTIRRGVDKTHFVSFHFNSIQCCSFAQSRLFSLSHYFVYLLFIFINLYI